MKIGLDIDGVLYPWHESLYRYFRESKSFGGTYREFWDYFKTLDLDTQNYFVSLPTLYLDTSPKDDVLKYVPEIAKLGDIFYITSRHHDLKWATRKFFNKYNLPFKENVIFSSDKANHVRLNRIDFFLDDLPHNIDSLKGICDTYLLRVVHNLYDREGYNTVGSLREFYEIIKSK